MEPVAARRGFTPPDNFGEWLEALRPGERAEKTPPCP